ncbi:hypothetical protein EW146_g6026 [Bondarzewia mesenterica]|uniref:Fe2OG dioxygenase domain-containing protein n=1 Tax=Bondarzewia mesenterica TaxID=1095465 RepID=A0A4V3XEN1_9AGAM|nr:hypothetical protein EW146_g6026 [Bondarzewia mesenterica]
MTNIEHSRGHQASASKASPILGPGDNIGEGDTYLVLDVLPKELCDTAFENLRKEVKWHTMFHKGGEVPRLVAVEGAVDADGSFPIYRHPADFTPPLLPFSPTVSLIRQHVERVLNHPVNHVLIQHYRTGADYISEHSDKTVDVVHGSNIVNVSLGAQRTMTLHTKKDALAPGVTTRTAQRVPLPHNSMFVMGLETNKKWMHSIHTDKRPMHTKSPPEQFQDGERISLTFRHIGTFLTRDEGKIYGQGAKGKTKEDARLVVNGGEEAEKLLAAFGKENHESAFVWDDGYGEGFDVLHFSEQSDNDDFPIVYCSKFRQQHGDLRKTIDRLEGIVGEVDEHLAVRPHHPAPVLPTIPLPTSSAGVVGIADANATSASSLEGSHDVPISEQDLLLGPADNEAISLPELVPLISSSALPSVSTTTTSTSSQPAPASAFVQNSSAVQEELSAQLAQMAGQLRRNAVHFSEALARDQAVVDVAEEKIGANYDAMKKERVRLRDHRAKSMGTTCLTLTSIFVVAVAFIWMFFIIRFT